MFIATLIAAGRLTRGDISAAADAIAAAGLTVGGESWIEPDAACDLRFSNDPIAARTALEPLFSNVDIVVQPEVGRRKRMLVADMDSTMITVECIDELADYAGFKDEVAAVTERAMRGELAFEAALIERVALLRGLDDAVIDRCREERVRLTPGARVLVRTMRGEGAYCLLVSGGFTRFADAVAAEIGFDRAMANRLIIDEGLLTGEVEMPILGAAAKQEALIRCAGERNIPLEATLGVGDGANDIPMLQTAGLGIAFHAKPAAAAAADGRIEHGDLTALLYAQGYARKQWAD